MKKLILFLFFLLVGVALVFAAASVLGVRMDNSQNTKAVGTVEASFKTKTTGTLEEGDVVVQLTPFIDGNRLVVKVAMNTHTVDLGQLNLKEAITLEYGDAIIKPAEAKMPEGHYSDGRVVFIVGITPVSFTIIIKGIPKTMERVYEWTGNVTG